MQLNREKIQRMMKGTPLLKGGSGSGSGGSGGGGGTAGYAEEAGHAQTADEATHATTAQNLASDSTDWNKIADKTIAQQIAEVWTFAKGIVSTLKSYFNHGIEVTNGVTTDTLTASGAVSIGGNTEISGTATLAAEVVVNDSLIMGNQTIWGDHDVDGNANIDGNATVGGTLGVTGKLTGGTAELQNLTVTKEMHVFKLSVDDLTSNKGAIIVTSADCTAEDVEEVTPGYVIYWENTDRDGNPVINPWKVGDLALCLTYKGEGSGTFANVVNRYYWRKVLDVQTQVRHGGDDKWYNTIMLSKAQGEYEGSTVPAVGDNIVQLGYNGQTEDVARQTAVILSAYPTMDTGVTPPSLAFYKGINDFNLSSHRYTYIDGLNNEFMGNFKILVNGNYENLTTVLATLEGLIMTVKGMVRGKNILQADGWTDNVGTLLGALNYDEDLQKYTNTDGEGSYDDFIWSPVFFLKAGTYTYSHYCTDNLVHLLVFASSQRFSMQNIPSSEIEDIFITNTVSGDTYQNAPRRYCTFTLDDDCYVCLNVYLSDDEFTMYRPMLEEGDEPSAWETGPAEHTSQVKILANAINLGIRAGLTYTGINIATGKVAVEADNFTVGKNGVQVFGVDTNTGVTTMQDVNIKGSLMYHKVVVENSHDYLALANATAAIHTSMKGDTFIVAYNSSPFRLSFPPAYLFPGVNVKIVVTKTINYELFITRLDDEEPEYIDNQQEVYNGFVNMLDSDRGVSTISIQQSQYTTLELVSVPNPVHNGWYCWMVVNGY